MVDFDVDKTYLQRLCGKVVIITGASSGIGLATVQEFTSHGAHVVAADINPIPLSASTDVLFQRIDIAKWADQVELFELALAKYGHIDVVFLNAGIYEADDVFADILDDRGALKEPECKTLKVNLLAQIYGTKLAIHYLRKQATGGAIVVTGSGFTGIGGTPMYSTAKHGLLGMVRTLGYDLGTVNVRINLMCPFWTDTGIVPKEVLEKSASAKRSMQSPAACSAAAAQLGLDTSCQGKVVYVAVGMYTDVDEGLMQCRPVWLGQGNHEDRLVWEQDPYNAENRTPL